MSIDVGPNDSQQFLQLTYTVLMLATLCACHDSTFVASCEIVVFVRLYRCRNSKYLSILLKNRCEQCEMRIELKALWVSPNLAGAEDQVAIIICSRKPQN